MFQIYFNAYAVDFWRLESKKALERDNGISENRVWSLIQNFSVCCFQWIFFYFLQKLYGNEFQCLLKYLQFLEIISIVELIYLKFRFT